MADFKMKHTWDTYNKRKMPTKWEHGVNGYNHRGCRCKICRKANADRMDRLRHSRPALAADDPRHGTATAYSYFRCRCKACVEVNSKASAAYRKKLRETPKALT